MHRETQTLLPMDRGQPWQRALPGGIMSNITCVVRRTFPGRTNPETTDHEVLVLRCHHLMCRPLAEEFAMKLSVRDEPESIYTVRTRIQGGDEIAPKYFRGGCWYHTLDSL